MKRNAQQNRILHRLIGKLAITAEEKEDLVMQYTDKRAKSSACMYEDECQRLINFLNTLLPDLDNQRKKFLSTCYDLKWTVDGKLDMPKVKKWLLDYGYLHKPLNSYGAKELPKLITQIETILKKDYAKT